mgnify:CR=1 FL=1
MILRGDVVDNIGREMPSPYIRRISITDSGIDVYLSIFLIENNADMDSIIKALSENINLYIYATVQKARFNNIVSGKSDFIEYIQNQELQTEYQAAMVDTGDCYISLDNIFSSINSDDGEITYTYLADKEVYTESGIKLWEFRITKSIIFNDEEDLASKQTVAGLWRNYANKLKNDFYLLSLEQQDEIAIEGETADWPSAAWDYYQWKVWDGGIYIAAFSSTIDLQDDDKIDSLIKNKALLSFTTSPASYEIVVENVERSNSDWEDSISNMSLPAQKQVEYMTSNNAIYNRTPIKSLNSQYYSDDKISRAQIITTFSSLIRPESGNYSLDNITKQITYVLEQYADSTELIVQLNLLKDLFPSKSTTTKIGKLYVEFKRMLYAVNSTIKQSSILSKKVIRNLKIIDERSKDSDIYTTPASSVNYADLESLGSSYIYPTWYQAIEYDTNLEIYTSYGFYFFDYQKALYTTSAIAQVYDMEKLTTLFGIDFPYSYFHLTESAIFRCEDSPCEALSDGMIKIIATMNSSTSPSYPLVEEISALNGSYNTNNLLFPYSTDIYGPSAESSKYGFSVTSQVPMLVNRPWSRNPSVQEESGYNYLPSDYRLMLFEYQDYFADLPSEEARYYGANILIRDTTKKIAAQIDRALRDSLSDLSDYLTAADSICSFNSITEQFNSFFISGIESIYSGSPETAPWNTAPLVYTMYKDLLYNSYDGDKDLIVDEAAIIIEQIRPQTGTIEALQSFYNKMDSLYNTMSELTTATLESYSLEQELEYNLPVGEGTLWSEAYALSEIECDPSASDSGKGECTDLYDSSYICNSLGKCEETERESDYSECSDDSDCVEGGECIEDPYGVKKCADGTHSIDV